jgi:hypothetical protein
MSPSSLQLTHPRVCVCVGELHSTQGSIKRHTHTCLVSSWVLPFALSGGAHIPHSAESQCEAGVMSPSIPLLGGCCSDSAAHNRHQTAGLASVRR